jgi:hypothetical protein
MPLLFSYGTLQQDNVQQATFGRLLKGSADALVGYAQSMVTIEDADVVAKSGKTIIRSSRSPARARTGWLEPYSRSPTPNSPPPMLMRSTPTSAFWRRSPPASTPGFMWTRDLRPGTARGRPRMPTILEGSRRFRHSEEKALRADRFEPVRCRDRLAGHLAVAYVQPRAQMRIVRERLAPALVSEREGERQRRVIEREG